MKVAEEHCGAITTAGGVHMLPPIGFQDIILWF
jgi:hypothetical protein